MKPIKLIAPTKEHEGQLHEYKKEFELNGDNLNGSAGLIRAKTYDEWLQNISDNAKTETVLEGVVGSSQYLAVRTCDNRIGGMINIRHTLNEYLLNFGGHIGYSVRKSERQKGYAKEMLRLALGKCKELGIGKILITCNKDNIASAKTILANGGVLENEVPEQDRVTQRYWIDIS